MNMLGSQPEKFQNRIDVNPSIFEKVATALESQNENEKQETNKENKIIYLMRLDAQRIYKQLTNSAKKYEDDRSAMFSYINYCINNTTANKTATYET